ncbi:MAG: molybdate ABC transporter substrate-binding protein [Planctomycetaceae bacterium]
MNRTAAAMLASLLALGGLAWMLSNVSPPGPGEPKVSGGDGEASMVSPVTLFCAASNRAVMESIRKEYEAETGRRVEIQYGPSQTLLSSIEVSGTGDLYLPADDSYLRIASEKSLVAEQLPLARMQAVVAVRKGNPKQITTFDDLLKEGNRVIQASPDAAAIGKVTRRILGESGLWDKLDTATVAYRTTVTDVANDLLVDAADAGIVYDAVLHTYPDLEFVELPELLPAASNIGIGVVASTSQPAAALHFARYVSAGDRGLMHYQNHGFRVASGSSSATTDEWADVPELSLFAGSMLRPAIDETITAFEQREGVRVNRVYNGCGILVAQMKGGQHPDAYFACDREFMNQVPTLFPAPVDVSQNELVILVQKGNPHQIASLRDLGRKGLRVGIGHEKQCAMGWLTQNTLKEGGVQKEVMDNVTVQTPTGDMLVNQLLTGSLDAAVVYLSNAAGAADKLDAIRIMDIECSIATQPFAVSHETRYPRLTERMFRFLSTAASRDSFEAEGFRWQLN